MPRPMSLDTVEAAIDQAIHDGMNVALTGALRAAADQGESCSGIVIDAFHRRLAAELRWYRRSWAAEGRARLRVLLNALGPRARDLVDVELLDDCEAGRRAVPRLDVGHADNSLGRDLGPVVDDERI